MFVVVGVLYAHRNVSAFETEANDAKAAAVQGASNVREIPGGQHGSAAKKNGMFSLSFPTHSVLPINRFAYTYIYILIYSRLVCLRVVLRAFLYIFCRSFCCCCCCVVIWPARDAAGRWRRVSRAGRVLMEAPWVRSAKLWPHVVRRAAAAVVVVRPLAAGGGRGGRSGGGDVMLAAAAAAERHALHLPDDGGRMVGLLLGWVLWRRGFSWRMVFGLWLGLGDFSL